VYAGAGQLNIVVVVLVGFIAAVLGDNVGYAIGHFGGHALVLRFGRYVFLTEERLGKAEGFFARHGGKVVTIARFIEGLRQANGIVAGLAEMRWRSFLVFNMLGAAIWVAVWSAVGYLAGDHLDAIYSQLHRYELYTLIAGAVVVLTLIARHLPRRGRTKPADQESPTHDHPRPGDDHGAGGRGSCS
jgi:membrane protein DedA with SNARE-associated domain